MACSIELLILNLINMKMTGGMLNTLTVNTVNDIRTIFTSFLYQHSVDNQYKQSEHFGKETILFYWFLRI